ncbi:hypothetical protein HY374_01940 [Candidatus Berkelbacteria bacterium]|nr:hypothetical protein [Candidatus Berkelbacteria bacterium]
MHQPLRLHPALVFAVLGLVLLTLGTPFISYWVSFFILGKVSVIARLLQTSAHPFFPLLPGMIAGGAVLVLGLLVGRRTASSMALAGTVLGGAMLVVSVLSVWFLSLLSLPRFQIHPLPFDAAKWAQADCDTTRVRQQMLADLNTKIEGLSQEQVTALIGEPTDGKSSYCLGPEPHVIPVDREFMQVLYTRDGRAAELKISAN